MIRLPHPIFVSAYLTALSAVVVLSLVPRPDLSAPEGADKALHLIAYAVIAGCGGLGFGDWNRRIFAGTWAIGIGIYLEFAQSAWAMRNGSIADAVSNTAGVILGLAGAWLLLKMFERLQPAAS